MRELITPAECIVRAAVFFFIAAVSMDAGQGALGRCGRKRKHYVYVVLSLDFRHTDHMTKNIVGRRLDSLSSGIGEGGREG